MLIKVTEYDWDYANLKNRLKKSNYRINDDNGKFIIGNEIYINPETIECAMQYYSDETVINNKMIEQKLIQIIIPDRSRIITLKDFNKLNVV